MVNTDIAIYDKVTGLELFRQTLSGINGFFASVGANSSVFDPWIVYDVESSRFFAIGIDIHETGTGVYVSPTDTGSDPLVADTDGDGYDDGAEVAAGTDPNDPQSAPNGGVPALGTFGWLLLGAFLLFQLAREALRAKGNRAGGPV